MADDPKKAAEEAKKDDKQRTNKPIVTVCTLNLRQILVALHEKALKEADSIDPELTVQNSAIEGAGGKDAKFYGAGQHIIAAISKDNKGIANNKVQKKKALPVLQTYVQWFVGPDIKAKVKENVLKPLENGAEGKTEDNHEKKEDIEKSKKDSVAGEKYEKNDETKKESTIFVPSFDQYLLTEAGEDDSSKKEAEDKAKKDKNATDEKKPEEGQDASEAQGWYVEYKMTIPGQKEHSILDAMKKFAGDLLKNFGIKFTSLFGGGGDVHTVGDFVEGLEAIFGKMDANEFESAVNEEIKTRMKGTDAAAKVWDTPTILKHLKKEVSKHKQKIAAAKFALCVKVNKNDPSYKLFNEDAIANIVNKAISSSTVMRGLGKRAMGLGIKGKEVILVNNYDDNKKNDKSSKDLVDKAKGSVLDSIQTKNDKTLITESISISKKERRDLFKQILETCFDFDNAFLINESEQDHCKTNNSLLENIFDNLDESLLLEKENVYLTKCIEQIDRIGHKNIVDNVDEFSSEWKKIMNSMKTSKGEINLPQDLNSGDNAKIYKQYLKKKYLKGADSTPFVKNVISKIRLSKDLNDVKHIFTNYPSEEKRVQNDSSEVPEFYAAFKALEKLPDGPKDEEKDDKITITFRDIDDPSEISSPEEPTDDDKEKYKTVGEPLELVPGEDVKIPEIKNKGKKGEWEFMGFDPDPENMDESGYTYATYTKNGPDTIKVTFYDADPETGDKLKEPLGDPIEVKIGDKLNSSSEAQEAFEKYDEKLQKDKKDGYEFKGWNPDPGTVAKTDDIDVVAKYIEEGEKDTKYTVMFQYAPDPEKPKDIEIIQVNGKDEQEVAAGEKAERPDVENLKEFKDLKDKGYKFKDWGEDEKNLDNVQDNIVAVAELQKIIMVNPKAPKDPEKPNKDLEPIGDPFEYDPSKPLEKELPEPPEKDGWKPTGEWDPDPKSIKDPKENIDIVPKYEKDQEDENSSESNATIYFKMQDPAFKNKQIEKLKDAFEPIKLGQKKDKDGKVIEDKFPNHRDAKNIPDGYATTNNTTWTIASTKEIATDDNLKDKIKQALQKNKNAKSVYVVLNLLPRYNFTIKVVDVDPEKPDDESKETLIASITVIYDKSQDKNVYKPEDIKKISDAIHNSTYPDEAYAKYIDKVIDENTDSLKKVSQHKTSSKGNYKVKPEILQKKIESKAQNPGIDVEKLPADKRVVKVKTSYNKEQFKVKIIQPDAEDPDNTKSQKEVATITVFKDAEGMHYKADDLAKLAKDVKTKDEADKYNKAAKDNEQAFKQVDNIQALTKDNAPYKFSGWAGPDGKVKELDKIITDGPADGEDELIVKAKFGNDIKAKHTDLDFYIVPMKGLKDKDKHKDNTSK